MPRSSARRRRLRAAAILLAALAALAAGAGLGARAARVAAAAGDPLVATFSIVGFDPELGDLGVAVQSKFPNVRAVVPWAKAGVGAVATQSFAELDYGRVGLELLERGATAEEALAVVLRGDEGSAQRQVGIVDARGNAASWTGESCFAWAGARVGRDEGPPARADVAAGGVGAVVAGRTYAVQGNILVSEATVDAMAAAFENARGELAERLLAALVAGGRAGGDRRGEQSAALLVVRAGAGYDGQDNFVDLSVYDHPTPIAEIVRLFELNRLHFRGSRPEDLIPVTPEIARELQEIWRARGFWSRPADGVVDAELQRVLIDFLGWENYDVRIAPVQAVDLAQGEALVIDREVLEDIRRVFRERRWKLRVDAPVAE